MNAIQHMVRALARPKTDDSRRREVNQRYYRRNRDRWVIYEIIDRIRLKKAKELAACS